MRKKFTDSGDNLLHEKAKSIYELTKKLLGYIYFLHNKR